MAKRRPLIFSEEDLLELQRDRYEHPHPRIQQRMEVLWLISQGVGYGEAARLAGVSPATGDRIVSMYRRGGVEALRQLNWRKPISELEAHHQTLEESFREQPPHTVNEACARIGELTGLKRGPTQVRRFFKKTLGLKWRRQGAIPLPPKKTIAEHIAVQAEFLDTQLEPALASARAGEGHVFFVDAAQFVMGSFLACAWCVARIMIRGGCGRQRYHVLGRWNAMTNELVRVTITTVVNSQTMAELLHKIAALGLIGPITLVLDNARYQHCVFIKELAATLNIRLLFLPGYSPNLNLIERLWKFTKNKALYGRHYKTFDAFQKAIDACLDRVSTEHRAALSFLMTHNFQTFDKALFLAA